MAESFDRSLSEPSPRRRERDVVDAGAKLRFGIMGMSEGNGHPFSWSAICNGYDPEAMADCGFPVIPEYLAAQEWPSARLGGVEVTHVWTQDLALSEKVARAGRIRTVVERPEEMVGKIDGVLLARDDAENHLMHARPFLEAGVPIYIDKPIALSLGALEEICSLARYDWQIFTCSAMRYAEELRLSPELHERIGEIETIRAVTPKSWDRYAVHIIEPVLRMLPVHDRIRHSELARSGRRSLHVVWESGMTTSFTALGHSRATISIEVTGNDGSVTLTPNDSFTAFKAALADFKRSVSTATVRSPLPFNRRVVSLIELGRET